MKTRFPLFAAIGFVLVWSAMIFAVPLTLDVFKGFKIEMPGLTMLMINAYHFGGGLALPMLLLATALLLGLRQSAGWVLALIFCVVCDLAFLGLALPVVSLANRVKGGLGAVAALSSGGLSFVLGFWLAVGALLFNQILFVLLLRKRREFFIAPQSNDSLLPVK